MTHYKYQSMIVYVWLDKNYYNKREGEGSVSMTWNLQDKKEAIKEECDGTIADCRK